MAFRRLNGFFTFKCNFFPFNMSQEGLRLQMGPQRHFCATQANGFGRGGLLWPVWDVSRRPQRTYLSFLNDLKPLIVICVHFTHAQPHDVAPLEQDMVDRLFHKFFFLFLFIVLLLIILLLLNALLLHPDVHHVLLVTVINSTHNLAFLGLDDASKRTRAHFLTLQLDRILFADGLANDAQFLNLV